jgi:hypothetical protein
LNLKKNSVSHKTHSVGRTTLGGPLLADYFDLNFGTAGAAGTEA